VLDYQIKLLEARIRRISVTELFNVKTDLSPQQIELLEKQIEMLKSGYPLDYLLGEVEILGLRLRLNENVLIPRPETEEWLQEFTKNMEVNKNFNILNSILNLDLDYFLKNHSNKDSKEKSIPSILKQNSLLVDLGCGSGIIGLYLSKFFDAVLATDISNKALKIAKVNAKINKKINIGFYQSNGFSNSLVTKRINNFCNFKKTSWTLVANLPYLPNEDKDKQEQYKVKYEPDLALYSGNDGLDLFRKVLTELGEFKVKPQQVIFELDPRNIRSAKSLLENMNYETTIWTDSGDFERVLIGNKR
jgi:release factor glutamine methyltransferase